MIAFLLPLSNVAIYGLAFFMATVILIPQKAIITPIYPLISTALKNNRIDELSKLYKQSSINQIIIGGVLFSLIWANINEIFDLIPSDFSDGKWVVFYIGLSRLFILSTGISNALIVFSPYYRVNLFLNLFLVVLTILTNYYLISRFGITGAAIATSITFFTYNILKTIYIQFRFKIQPFTIDTLKSLLVLFLVTLGASMITISEDHAILSILSKSIIIALLMAIGFYGLKVKAEVLDVPGRVIKRFF
jgi:O-antigen/teichoic acid export membrane protein